MPTYPVAFRTPKDGGGTMISAAGYTADQLPAVGDEIEIGGAKALVEALERDGPEVLIVAERIDHPAPPAEFLYYVQFTHNGKQVSPLIGWLRQLSVRDIIPNADGVPVVVRQVESHPSRGTIGVVHAERFHGSVPVSEFGQQT